MKLTLYAINVVGKHRFLLYEWQFISNWKTDYKLVAVTRSINCHVNTEARICNPVSLRCKTRL